MSNNQRGAYVFNRSVIVAQQQRIRHIRDVSHGRLVASANGETFGAGITTAFRFGANDLKGKEDAQLREQQLGLRSAEDLGDECAALLEHVGRYVQSSENELVLDEFVDIVQPGH